MPPLKVTRVERCYYLAKIVLLILFCGIPYLLRETAGERWEPYPALLLPSGAGVVNVGGANVTAQRMELLSVAVDGQERELSPATFFKPLPDPYWVRIVLARLGLNGTDPSRRYAQASDAIRRVEVEEWLRRRLAAVGRAGDQIFRVRMVRLTLDTVQHRELRRETSWTYDIPL